MTQPRPAATRSRRPGWLLPTGLIMLSFVPVAASAFRVFELASGAEVTPENARFFAAPVPVLVHVIGASIYCVLGAFQFAPGIRRRWPGWHRAAGRLLVPTGLAAALSALWMTLFYPRPPEVGELLIVFRLGFGTAMAVFIVLGFLAVRRRDIARHRAWMMRAYAIGLGAGTQGLVLGPFVTTSGPLDQFPHAMLMFTAWAINLLVAEWAIRRIPRSPVSVSPHARSLEVR